MYMQILSNCVGASMKVGPKGQTLPLNMKLYLHSFLTSALDGVSGDYVVLFTLLPAIRAWNHVSWRSSGPKSHCEDHGEQMINLLKTKRRPLYLKTQSVPRCKHFSSRL